jgi:SAM-dependent methyltransferase
MPANGLAEDVYQGEAYGFVRSPRTDAFVDGTPHAVRILRELEADTPPGRLLDVGCATGDFLAAAQERSWAAQGVELSGHAAAVARRRGVDVRVGTLRNARFPDASFDVVTMLDVIEHLNDPMAELKEVRRVLRPGGIICVETPNWDSIYRRVLGRRWAALQPRLHLLYFDSTTLREAVGRAGFHVFRNLTEIVALFSPEGIARGLGPSSARSILRDLLVRQLLRLPSRRLDQFFLRIGPAARINAAAGSFKQLAASGVAPAQTPSVPPSGTAVAALRRANAPLDRLFLKLGMGEQLRVHARRT